MTQVPLKICFFSLFFLAAQLLTSSSLHAETRYINDRLIISLRTGPGKTYKVKKTLKTGTLLKVLADNGEFIKVETAGGLTGWVAKYYTDSKLPKALVIEQQRTKLITIEKELKKQQEINRHSCQDSYNDNEKLSSRIDELLAQKKQNDLNFAELTSKHNELQGTYEQFISQSGDIIKTTKERNELKQGNIGLKQKIILLKATNKSLENYRMIYWFLAGGGILLIGWILGRTSKNKKTRTLSL